MKRIARKRDGWYACPDGHAHKFSADKRRCLCGTFNCGQAGDRVYPTHGNYVAPVTTFREAPIDPECEAANVRRWGRSRRQRY